MPTLILHGDRDADVPIEQAHILYRALKEHGVETEFVYYPGGGHGISHARPGHGHRPARHRLVRGAAVTFHHQPQGDLGMATQTRSNLKWHSSAVSEGPHRAPARAMLRGRWADG